MTGQMGKLFDESRRGHTRRYWFVGGLAAGILGVGTIRHWGIYPPDVALVIGGGLLVIALRMAKDRGEWDV